MAVDTVDINVDINRNDIKIHIGGGFWTDLASIFKVFFKGTVVDLINTAVTAALEAKIPAITNAALAENNGFFHAVPNFWYDWESPIAAKVTTSSWDLSMKGLLFDHRFPEALQAPDVAIPEMPYSLSSVPA
jgi:hypothetical protein